MLRTPISNLLQQRFSPQPEPTAVVLVTRLPAIPEIPCPPETTSDDDDDEGELDRTVVATEVVPAPEVAPTEEAAPAPGAEQAVEEAPALEEPTDIPPKPDKEDDGDLERTVVTNEATPAPEAPTDTLSTPEAATPGIGI
uniref:Uncharacterized protein n=1 Tax=Anopheles farauti TaxID=69004 RepID=A0A182Q4J8_9DIPT